MTGLKRFLWFFAAQSQSAIWAPPCTSQTFLISNTCRSYPPCFTFRPISRSLPWILSTATSRVCSESFWLIAKLKPNHLSSFAFSNREIISTNQVHAILVCFHFTSSLETRCINCCMYQQALRGDTKICEESLVLPLSLIFNRYLITQCCEYATYSSAIHRLLRELALNQNGLANVAWIGLWLDFVAVEWSTSDG